MAYKRKRSSLSGRQFRRNVKRKYSKKRYVRARPSRFRYSRRSYRKNMRMANAMSKFCEKKLQAMVSVDESTPLPIQTGAQAYYWGGVTGDSVPTVWSGTWQPLEGFNFAEGTGHQERIGRYMFLDHSTASIQISYNAQADNQQPLMFRMIVFKARRATDPAGTAYDPSRSLFLGPLGNQIGHGTGGIRFTDLQLQPTNKRDWIIFKDTQFTLSPTLRAGTTDNASWQGKYPNSKKFRLRMNHKIKAAFQSTTGQPVDYDYHWGIVIYAGEIGRDGFAGGWEVNLRGNTTAYDN